MAVVLCLAPYKFLPAATGGQRHIALFYKYFGQEVSIIAATVKSNENGLAENYQTIPLFTDSSLRYINPLNLFSLKRIIKEHKITHVLIEHPYLGWLAILLKKFTSVELVVHSHNIEGLRFKQLGKWWWRLLLSYEGFVHRQADYNLFIQSEDLRTAVETFRLQQAQCIVLTYGIEQATPPTGEEKETAKDYICRKHHIDTEDKLILFVGAFNYRPNLDAYNVIKEKVDPLLRNKYQGNYKILVCGLGLEAGRSDNIIITGFVDDISIYFKAADVFINPVESGGGIKTKLVEAIGWNTNAVSTELGAIGVDISLTYDKLLIAKTGDWQEFVRQVMHALTIRTDTPMTYYHYFYWGNIAKSAAKFIER